ncbi:MAG: septum formation initiator family protein [Gordonia sp. (in: high G+C Gram-positive bacteria)]
MASGSGRSRTSAGRRRAQTARDRRSRERARRVPHRERSTSGRSPVSVMETGEQEVFRDGEFDDVSPESVRWSGRSDARGQALARRVRGIDTKRAVVLALVLSVVALTLAVPLRTYFSQHAEFTQLAASNAQLRDQVADYQRKVNEQNDPAYIEAKARERLQFVKPGETPLVMLYPGDAARKAAARRVAQHRANPWYANLWETVSTPVGTR